MVRIADAPSTTDRGRSRILSGLQLQFTVSSKVFITCWIGVLVLHITSVFFLMFMGAVHLLISLEAVYRSVWLLRITQPTLRVAGWTYLALAVPHVVAIAKDVRHSIRCRRLTFASDVAAKNSAIAVKDNATPDSSVDHSWVATLRRLPSTWRKWWRQMIHHAGVNGKHFMKLFKVRQSIEIISQMYQTYLFSRTVPRLVIIRLLLVLLLMNCVYMPMVNVTFKGRHGPRLAAILGIDLFLDVASSTIVPLVIIVPRFLEFDWVKFVYHDDLRFNEVWFVSALSECRQVMVSSTLDYITTLVPYVAAIDSLATLKTVLMRVADTPTRQPSMVSVVSINPAKHPLEPRQEPAMKRSRSSFFASIARPTVSVFDKFTVFAGFLVLVFHLHAELRAANVPNSVCRLPMKPWFAQNMSCGIFELNCYREGITGNRTHVHDLLKRMDRESLMKFLVNHCPSFSMPSNIIQFPNLLGIQTLNTTISEWPLDASISQTHHPKMAEIQFFATNVTEFPQGLLHDDLPSRLSLVIHISNLTELPDDVGDKWGSHNWPYLSFQHVPLTHLPTTFHKVSVYYLTLFDNLIASIPDNEFANFQFTMLRLSNNPLLSELPSTFGRYDDMRLFVAEDTNVSQLTPWLIKWRQDTGASAVSSQPNRAVMSFAGSPICELDGLLTPNDRDDLCIPTGAILAEDSRYDTVVKLRPL